MIRRSICIDKITWYLGHLIPTIIPLQNKIGLFDINEYSENYFKDILNLIYDLGLINMNEIKVNFPAIDLGDKAKKISYQVTSEKDREKIEYTVSQFVKHELDKSYDELRVLILTGKKNYSKQFITPDGLKLVVLDTADLIKDISKIETDRLESLVLLLEKELGIHPNDKPQIEVLEGEYHSELNRIKTLILQKKPSAALTLLQDFKNANWNKSSDAIKYRVTSNIGSCLRLLDKQEDGAKCFVEALQYKSDDELALSNAAYGFLILGEIEKANEYAKLTIQKNPLSTSGYACLIAASSDNMDEVIKTVPRSIRNDATVAFAISNEYQKRGEVEKAITWGQIALVGINSEDRYTLEGQLGSYILQKTINESNKTTGIVLTAEQYQLLDEAAQLLNSCIESLKDTELIDKRLSYITNRGICKFAQNKYKDAMEDFKYVVQRDPKDFHAFRHMGMIYISENKIDAAIEILSIFENLSLDLPGTILLTEAYRLNKNVEKCRKVCEMILADKSLSEMFHENALNVLAVLIAENEEYPDSFNQINKLQETFGYSACLNNIKSNLLRRNKKLDEAKILVVETLKIPNEQLNTADLSNLGREAVGVGLFVEAADILEKIVEKNPRHPDGKLLLLALYRSDQYERALNWLNIINEDNQFDEQSTEIESVIYDELGDIPKSVAACKRFLNSRKPSLSIQTRLGSLLLRLNKVQELDSLLQSEIKIDVSEESIDCVIMYSNLLVQRGLISKSLELLYELRRVKSKASSKPHTAFFHNFLRCSPEMTGTLDVSGIKVGTWFKYKINNEDEGEILVEDRPTNQLLGIERNLEDPLVKRLLDKKTNETVVLSQGIIPREIKVLEIKHKYVYAFQDAGDLLNSHFVEDNVLQKFSLPKNFGEDGKLPDEMMQMLKSSQERMKKFEQHVVSYNERKLPLGLLARISGKSVLEQFEALIGIADSKIASQYGSVDEVNLYKKSISEATDLHFDITSLFTIWLLGIQDYVKKGFNKLCTTQATVDAITILIRSREQFKNRDNMSMFMVDNEVRKYVQPQESVEKNLLSLIQLRDWILNNVEISSVEAKMKMEKTLVEDLDNGLSSEITSVLYGSSIDSCIVCEDIVSREIFRVEFKRRVTSVKAICDNLYSKGVLPNDDYHKAVASLITYGFDFIEINVHNLIGTLKNNNFEVTSELEAMLKILNGKKSLLDGAADIVAKALLELWKLNLLDFKQDVIIDRILEAYFLDRNREDAKTVLMKNVGKVFSLLPISYADLDQKIKAWLIANKQGAQ